MPKIKIWVPESGGRKMKEIDSYAIPGHHSFYLGSEAGREAARTYRREAVHRAEGFRSVMKLPHVSRDDRKFLKDMVKEAQQQERAATIVLNWFDKDDQREHGYLPFELSLWLDHVFHDIEIAENPHPFVETRHAA